MLNKATKKDIVTEIATQTGSSRAEAERTYETVITAIQECMSTHDGVSCVGLGTFKRVDRAGRWHRNPQTNSRVFKDAHQAIKFKPSPAFASIVE